MNSQLTDLLFYHVPISLLLNYLLKNTLGTPYIVSLVVSLLNQPIVDTIKRYNKQI